MPNWCSNELKIQGNPKELSKLIKKVQITKSEATENHYESVFSCHRVIPRPIDQEANWYDWNVTNWGSKWDLNDVRFDGEVEDKEVSYYFESAWSPVVPVIEALAKEFKKLSFTYAFYETGSDYWGELEYKKGELVSEEGGDVSSAGCERLEYLMGGHHYCAECYDLVECYGDKTPNLCEDCLANDDEQEVSLWEGETNDSQTSSPVKDVSGF
jgi:hypothetical protein